MAHEYHYCPICDTSFAAPLSDAAPDLLAACEDALQWMEANLLPTDKSGFESRKLLRAAIAKATSPQAR